MGLRRTKQDWAEREAGPQCGPSEGFRDPEGAVELGWSFSLVPSQGGEAGPQCGPSEGFRDPEGAVELGWSFSLVPSQGGEAGPLHPP